MARTIKLTSDLKDALIFSSLSADEALGRLFRFSITARSKNAKINLRDLLGTPMTVSTTLDNGYARHFHGIVSEAEQTGFDSVGDNRYAVYAFTVVPKPWLLTRRADCRIYKDQSVVDIIKLVLGESGYSDVKPSLSGTYSARKYCVQYRETYFNFISRLMEQEGIYYYFEHTASTHTMVLADSTSGHKATPKFAELPYVPVTDTKKARDAVISEWKTARSVQTTKYQLTDYDWSKSKTPLDVAEVVGNLDAVHKVTGLEAFDSPSEYLLKADGTRYATVRVEALNVPQAIYTGATNAAGFVVGALVKMTEFPRAELNQEYLIVSTALQMEDSALTSGGAPAEAFSCQFEVIESKQPFRSAQTTPRPLIAGVQTAVVCGKKGEIADEEIVVDEYGCVQVIFHWNKADKPNHDISCPVRVATPWAGKTWGMSHHPRVGQEVIVSFLEGDPDRPLVVGSVYNDVNRQFMILPGSETWSGVVSRSHKSADWHNANGILFDDKKGGERFTLQAEKDMQEHVKNDHTVNIDNDETETIKGNRTHTIEKDETFTIKMNRTHDVGKEDKLTVGANSTTDVKQTSKLTAGSAIELVTGASSIKMTSSGDITIKGVNIVIEGSMSVKMEGKMTVDIKAGISMNVTAGVSLNVKSDVMAEFAAGAMNTVKAPLLTLKADGIAMLSGPITMIG